MKDDTLSQSFPEAFTMIFFDYSNFPFRFVDKDIHSKSGANFIRLPAQICLDEYTEEYPNELKAEAYFEKKIPLYINHKCVVIENYPLDYYDPL